MSNSDPPANTPTASTLFTRGVDIAHMADVTANNIRRTVKPAYNATPRYDIPSSTPKQYCAPLSLPHVSSTRSSLFLDFTGQP